MTISEPELDRLRRALMEASEAAQVGSECPAADSIWRAVTGRLSPADAAELLDHSASCGACAQAWVLAHELAAEAQETDAPVLPFRARLPSPGSRVLVLAAAVVLAAGAALVVGYRAGWLGVRDLRVAASGANGAWADLPVEPAPYPGGTAGGVWRGGGTTVSAQAAAELARAMQSYESGDYATAAAGLGAVLDAHPDLREARFFLGVSLLLAGHSGDAAVHLARTVAEGGRSAPPGHRWYLSLALLKSGRDEDALRQLDELVGQGGPFAARAAELRAQVRALAGAGR